MEFWIGFTLAGAIALLGISRVLWKTAYVTQSDDEYFRVRRLLGPNQTIAWSSIVPTAWRRRQLYTEYAIKYGSGQGAESYLWIIRLPTQATNRFEQVLRRRATLEEVS